MRVCCGGIIGLPLQHLSPDRSVSHDPLIHRIAVSFLVSLRQSVPLCKHPVVMAGLQRLVVVFVRWTLWSVSNSCLMLKDPVSSITIKDTGSGFFLIFLIFLSLCLFSFLNFLLYNVHIVLERLF